MTKIMLIGVDAASWKIIQPLIAKGELPTFASLIQEGVSAPLKSLRGYKSPALWASIATGKTPEKNGILYFSNLFLDLPKLKVKKDLTKNIMIDWPHRIGKIFSKNKKEISDITTFSRKVYVYSMLKYGKILERFGMGGNYLITSASRTEKAIWEILSEEGLQVSVIGWLATWPAEKLNGIMVSQRGIEKISQYQHQTKFKVEKDSGHDTYPQKIIEELKSFKRTPDTISDAELTNFFSGLNKEEVQQIKSLEFDRKNKLKFFSQLYLIDLFSAKTGIFLRDRNQNDFVTVYLPGLDGIQHLFWQYYFPQEFPFIKITAEEITKLQEVIPNYYKFLDKQIAALIEGCETVIVLSDHGMESIPEKDFDQSAIRSGQHEDSTDGILIIKGPQVKKNVTMKEAHILDLAPTILYLLGKSIDANMDGEVLTEAITDNFLKENSIQKKDYGKKKAGESSVYNQEEQEKVKERLKALGYLD